MQRPLSNTPSPALARLAETKSAGCDGARAAYSPSTLMIIRFGRRPSNSQ
jgi:hypothetical protein